MSTMTTPAPTAGPARETSLYKVTGRRVLRSEWAKFWSLRSSWITLGLALLFMFAFGLVRLARYHAGEHLGGPGGDTGGPVDAVALSLFGINFAQLALGVLGVLVTAGEYSTGMIRSTLAAVPRRLPVLWSKAAVYGVVALLLGTFGAFAVFLSGSGIVSGTPAALSLTDAGVVRGLFGAGLYLGLIGVIGVALGALLRSVAGGISVLVGALMLAPGLVELLPSSWSADVGEYLPSDAGQSLFSVQHAAHSLSPGPGLAVFAGWTALALAGAAYRLVRSDA
jgi:ABC-2 type transport system permease protein